MIGQHFNVQYFDKDVNTYLDFDDDDELPPGSQLKVEVLNKVLVQETCVDSEMTQFDGIVFSSEDPLSLSAEEGKSSDLKKKKCPDFRGCQKPVSLNRTSYCIYCKTTL